MNITTTLSIVGHRQIMKNDDIKRERKPTTWSIEKEKHCLHPYSKLKTLNIENCDVKLVAVRGVSFMINYIVRVSDFSCISYIEYRKL